MPWQIPRKSFRVECQLSSSCSASPSYGTLQSGPLFFLSTSGIFVEKGKGKYKKVNTGIHCREILVCRSYVEMLAPDEYQSSLHVINSYHVTDERKCEYMLLWGCLCSGKGKQSLCKLQILIIFPKKQY